MNTISAVQNLTMDGQALFQNAYKVSGNKPQVAAPVIQDAAQVAQNIERSMAEIKADSQQLQKMSEVVSGNKLQFSVNKELGSVVVTIVDSSTNQVVKEIPSEDMQKLKIRIRKAIGSLYDKLV